MTRTLVGALVGGMLLAAASMGAQGRDEARPRDLERLLRASASWDRPGR